MAFIWCHNYACMIMYLSMTPVLLILDIANQHIYLHKLLVSYLILTFFTLLKVVEKILVHVTVTIVHKMVFG